MPIDNGIRRSRLWGLNHRSLRGRRHGRSAERFGSGDYVNISASCLATDRMLEATIANERIVVAILKDQKIQLVHDLPSVILQGIEGQPCSIYEMEVRPHTLYDNVVLSSEMTFAISAGVIKFLTDLWRIDLNVDSQAIAEFENLVASNDSLAIETGLSLAEGPDWICKFECPERISFTSVDGVISAEYRRWTDEVRPFISRLQVNA